jgi:hypothetical protein
MEASFDMSIQEWVNRKPGIAIAIVAAVLIAAIAFSVSRMNARRGPLASRQAFFSDDDGQTYFRDSASKIPPFDHNGKTACAVTVLRCASGKPFVAYLQQYDAATVARIQDWMKQSTSAHPRPGDMPSDPIMQVKRPGESTWYSISAGPKNYARVTTPTCPDGGSGPFSTVTPDDSNSGATN